MSATPPPVRTAPSDAELIAAVAARDRAAFVTLFERYAGRIKAFAMRGGTGAADADEIAQDVMVSVWRNAASFDPARAGPSTWIFAIARNRRIDQFRRAGRPAPDPADPLFQPEGDTRTLAEYADDEKNAVSHRGRAARRLREMLERLGRTAP